jgi:hypothetical protein
MSGCVIISGNVDGLYVGNATSVAIDSCIFGGAGDDVTISTNVIHSDVRDTIAYTFTDNSAYKSHTNLMSSTFDEYGSGHIWNAGHPVLGAYQLWVDSAGRLRIKAGSPTSETDGTIVGTQT